MAKAPKAPKTGLTKKHWFGYMFGDWGGCMTFALMGSVVTMYYTDILHVNTVTLAILLLVWNIWDAINDPLMGALMDKMFARHNHPKGKFRPWLLRSTPLVAISHRRHPDCRHPPRHHRAVRAGSRLLRPGFLGRIQVCLEHHPRSPRRNGRQKNCPGRCSH